MPFSMLITAKLLRRSFGTNPTKNAPYESAEATIGESRDIINEYLPYFIIFLPFEVITIVLIFWSPVARQLSSADDISMVMLVVMALLFAVAGYQMIRGKHE